MPEPVGQDRPQDWATATAARRSPKAMIANAQRRSIHFMDYLLLCEKRREYESSQFVKGDCPLKMPRPRPSAILLELKRDRCAGLLLDGTAAISRSTLASMRCATERTLDLPRGSVNLDHVTIWRHPRIVEHSGGSEGAGSVRAKSAMASRPWLVWSCWLTSPSAFPAHDAFREPRPRHRASRAPKPRPSSSLAPHAATATENERDTRDAAAAKDIAEYPHPSSQVAHRALFLDSR